MFILSAAFRVSKGNKVELLKKMAQIREDRAAKGPLQGSPAPAQPLRITGDFGAPSGVLIERAGLKGTRLGGAAVF